jgi:hypothetical protein
MPISSAKAGSGVRVWAEEADAEGFQAPHRCPADEARGPTMPTVAP